MLRFLNKLAIIYGACAIITCSVLPSVEIDEPKIAVEDYEEVETVRNFTEAQVKTILKNDEESDKVNYDGYQLWKVKTDSVKTLKIIGAFKENLDIKTWGGNRSNVDILVSPDNLKKIGGNFTTNQIDYEIIIDNLQKAIDEENPQHNEEDEEFQHRYGHRMTFTSYHRLADIHNYLNYLAETYPSFCKVFVIGNSVEGRPLKLLKISNGNQGNKAVWIDGGIHAREWITPATVSYIIEHLVHNIDTESKTLQNMDYYVLPVTNPDGYEYSHNRDRLWRKNRARGGSQCVGTDLNRNYGYKWGGKGSGSNPCQDTYAGSGPFSEPETAAIKRFITSTKANWKASISYHSYGQYILYPWGYDRLLTVDNNDLRNVAQNAANAIRQTTGNSYTIGPAGATLYPASGGSDDWAKGAAGIKYAYTIELRDNGRYGFVLPASYIVPTAKEGLAAFRVIVESAAKV